MSKSKNLTPNQEIFVCEYLIDRNGRRSYMAAYPNVKKEHTADVNASRLLSNAKVKAAIDEALKRQAKRLELSADNTLKETARVAFSDIGKLFDENGNLKALAEMEEDARAFVSSIETSRALVGGSVAEITKVKLWDKMKALDNLGKYFKLFTDRTELSGPGGGPIETNVTIKLIKAEARDEC